MKRLVNHKPQSIGIPHSDSYQLYLGKDLHKKQQQIALDDLEGLKAHKQKLLENSRTVSEKYINNSHHSESCVIF